MDSIKALLRGEIERDLEALGDVEVGTDEYKASLDGVVKLTDRFIELEKIDTEIQDKHEARHDENQLKRAQMKSDRKFQVFRCVLDVAGIVVPIVVTVWGTKKSFEFEKEGTITTIMGKGFIGNLLRPFRR